MAYVLYLKSLYECVLTIRYCLWRSKKNCEVSIQCVISHQTLCEQVLIINKSIHQLKLSVDITWGGMMCSQTAGSITKHGGEQNLGCVGVIGRV
jgi:prephenate dehydratase